LAQDRLPHTFSAGEVGFDGGFEFVDDGQAVIDSRYDTFLSVQGWKPGRPSQVP
jgi:hypothetical protein